jgi:hypothetical protein
VQKDLLGFSGKQLGIYGPSPKKKRGGGLGLVESMPKELNE